jgi:PKD repeat protein
LAVNFTDESTGEITDWSWDFGDGGTSTAQNPSHTYNSGGTYTVELTVTGPGGSDTETRTDYITVNVGPTADFAGSPTNGTEPLTVSFTDQSSGATSWSWDFGDGGTSTVQNPSHEYAAAGTYTVALTVTNSCGNDIETKTDYITVNPCQAPVAGFNGTPTSGETPLTVNFTDASTNSPTSWSWDFGDGGTSTAQNPSHQYTSAGTYTVSLTATNSCGSDIETKTDYITVTCTAPTADFSGSPTSGDAPLIVNFTDQSSAATSWSWDFGDGGTSTAQNPSHQYTSAGTYTVALTATNSCGSDIETKTDYITVTEATQDEMHVHNISVSKQSFWIWSRATATVTIYDQGNNPVSSATVYGSFSGPRSQNVSGNTNSSGQVTFTSNWTSGSGEWCFEVTDVVKSGWVYNSSANQVTQACESGPVYSTYTMFSREGVPESRYMLRNYPNPFNPSTMIAFDLTNSGQVSLKVYNILGQEVRTLVDRWMDTGIYEFEFDATGLSSGVYFYRLQMNDYIETKRMMFLK